MRLLTLVLFCLALLSAGCSRTHHHHKYHIQTLNVMHLKDGRYAYYDNDGMFWFYMYMLNTNNSSSVYVNGSHSYNYYSDTAPTQPLSGGTWVSTEQLKTSPIQEEQLEMALNDPKTEMIPEPVQFDEGGNPANAQDITEEQMELNFSETPAENAETTTSENQSTSDNNSSNDSSSGNDSGNSGGNSGGDSGSSSGGDSGGGGGGGD